jgi:hypothetical protein
MVQRRSVGGRIDEAKTEYPSRVWSHTRSETNEDAAKGLGDEIAKAVKAAETTLDLVT